MQSKLELGHCPICGDPYIEQTVMPDGTPVKMVGKQALVSDSRLLVKTNYRDQYLVLDDLTLTRVSYCAKHDPTQAELYQIFELTREYTIKERRENGGESAAHEIHRWENLRPIDNAKDEITAHRKLKQFREAKIIGKPDNERG